MANLYEQIQEEEKTLLGETNETVEETKEEVVEEQEEVKEESVEEVSEPVKEEVKETPDKETYARLRWEASEAKRRAKELEEKLAEKEAVKLAPEKTNDLEPNKAEDLDAWLDWKNRQLERKQAEIENEVKTIKQSHQEAKQQQEYAQVAQDAVKEFKSFEDGFKSKVSDYDEVAGFYVNKIKDSIRTLNPDLSEEQIGKMTGTRILQTAGQYAQMGLDPVETMYNSAKKMGYTPKVEVKRDETPKKSVNDIAENKRKSASSMAAGGKTNTSMLTKEAVANMSMSEFSRLSPSQLRALENE